MSVKTDSAPMRAPVQWIVDGEVEDDVRQLGHDRLPTGNLFRQGFGGNQV